MPSRYMTLWLLHGVEGRFDLGSRDRSGTQGRRREFHLGHGGWAAHLRERLADMLSQYNLQQESDDDDDDESDGE